MFHTFHVHTHDFRLGAFYTFGVFITLFTPVFRLGVFYTFGVFLTLFTPVYMSSGFRMFFTFFICNYNGSGLGRSTPFGP
jgi:hypothetical protein